MTETKCERMYYTAQDLQEMLGISRALAYKILKKMNTDFLPLLKSQERGAACI